MCNRAGKRGGRFRYCIVVSGSKAGRGDGHGGGRAGTNKGKLDSRSRHEGLLSQARVIFNHCQKPGHIRPNYPKRQWFKCWGWGHEVDSCPSKIAKDKLKGWSAAMTILIRMFPR